MVSTMRHEPSGAIEWSSSNFSDQGDFDASVPTGAARLVERTAARPLFALK
jgi:hypothetical protein